LEKLDRTEAQKKRYKEIDENGNAYMWELFRKRGSNSERSARPTLFYPLYIKGTEVRVPAMAWDGANRCWCPLESADEHETTLFPIDDNGTERTWRYKREEVLSSPENFRAAQDREGKWTVYYKYRPASDGVLPTTMWTDSKFSATEHGTGVLKKLFGKSDAFSYPKSVFAVEESIKVAGAATDDAWVMDFFGGSGTTAHAIALMNTSADTGARFLLVEANPYFESVIVPRIKKVACSLNWVEGQAQNRDGRGIFARIQTLEQYEDTLENFALPTDEVGEDDLFDDAAFALRYRLDRSSRRAYCDIAHFASPFGYQLKRVEGGGDALLVTGGSGGESDLPAGGDREQPVPGAARRGGDGEQPARAVGGGVLPRMCGGGERGMGGRKTDSTSGRPSLCECSCRAVLSRLRPAGGHRDGVRRPVRECLMAAPKRSGHARLKAALVLRDALCAELGLPLPAAMAQLCAVEREHGCAQALDAGKYLAALSSVGTGDGTLLTELDGAVRAACHRAGLAPRYAQYLALLLFAAWIDAQHQDADALLERLNGWLERHPPRGEEVAPFSAADLQLAAFWMATAAGKTHVLHACLAMLDEARAWNAILLITPSEALTRQHAEKLRATGAWDVFAYPQDGDVSALGRQLPGTVIVLDINKLATDKRGDGVTVPTSVFKDGCNLVFVDEGHKGQKSEASTWKALQSDLARGGRHGRPPPGAAD